MQNPLLHLFDKNFYLVVVLFPSNADPLCATILHLPGRRYSYRWATLLQLLWQLDSVFSSSPSFDSLESSLRRQCNKDSSKPIEKLFFMK